MRMRFRAGGGLRPGVRLNILLCALLGFGCAADKLRVLDPFEAELRVRLSPAARLQRPLSRVPNSNRERADRTAELFRAAGCRGDQLVGQKVRGADLPNLICVLPGETNDMIVISAHYERRVGSRGLVDNWTGAAMLPALYRSLASERRHHTFLFLASADETNRSRGALEFVRRLRPDQLERTRAAVALLGVGLDTLAGWGNIADPNLWLDLQSVSKGLGLPVRNASFRTPVHDDVRHFRIAGVPTLVFHSFNRQNSAIVTRDPGLDRGALVEPARYADSHRLISFYLAYLDESLQARRSLYPPGTEPPPRPWWDFLRMSSRGDSPTSTQVTR